MTAQEVSFYLVMMMNVFLGITFLDAENFQRAFGIKPDLRIRVFLNIFVAAWVYILLGSLGMKIVGGKLMLVLMLLVGLIHIVGMIIKWRSDQHDHDDDDFNF